MRFIGKCLFLDIESKKTLVIGDMHLGWEESMNKSGVLVSRQMYDEIIGDLDKVFDEVGKVDRVVLLGDVKHAFNGNSMQEWDDLNKLFEYLEEKCDDVLVCRGNHDNYLLNVSSKFTKVKVEEYFILGNAVFMHGNKDFPEIYGKNVKTWVMGHLHPAVKLREEDGVKEEKYKCFLEGEYKHKKIVVLPSFFPVIEGSDVHIEGNLVTCPWDFDIKNWNVHIVADDLEVLDFGKLKNIN